MFCLLTLPHPTLVGIRASIYPGLMANLWDGSNSSDKKLRKYYVTYNQHSQISLLRWRHWSMETIKITTTERYSWDSLPGGFLSVTFIPFTHTIYTLITHKCRKGHSKRKTLNRFSTTYTPIFWERTTHP